MLLALEASAEETLTVLPEAVPDAASTSLAALGDDDRSDLSEIGR